MFSTHTTETIAQHKHHNFHPAGLNIWHGHLHVFQVSKTNDNQLAKAEENWVSKKKHNVSQMFWDHFQMPGLVGLAHKKKTFELLKS